MIIEPLVSELGAQLFVLSWMPGALKLRDLAFAELSEETLVLDSTIFY
jgi:hypothetical protein